MTSVLARYEARIADGVIDADSAQAEAAARLDTLAKALADKGKSGWFSKPAPVTGLYLWGGVGRGKSMLMDLFFEAAPVTPKRRVHFHEFMGSVHDMLGEWRSMDDGARKRSAWRVRGAGDDPIAPAAKRWQPPTATLMTSMPTASTGPSSCHS